MREAEIKRVLTRHLVGNTPRTPGVFIEELQINGGEVRADLVHLLDDIHCYEIKSDTDTLRRLVGQGSRYSRAFDRITLVVAERHLVKALPLLPRWWGVLVITESEDNPFKQVREAKSHRQHRPEVIASLLKRDEALHVLEELGASKGWKSKSLYLIQDYLAQLLPLGELRRYVRDSLARRGQSEAAVFSTVP
jgi:hypothetical protein